jgi:adenylate kinase
METEVMLKKKNLVFLGAPGAGKGTFSEELHKREHIVHISTGDLLRAEIATGSELGKQAAMLIDHGNLVPDEIVGAMVARKLATPECEEKGFILDGFPRNLDQAHLLNDLLKAQKKKLDAVVCLNVPEELIIKRLSRRWNCRCGCVYNSFYIPPKQPGICDECGGELYQRPDDNPETVKDRLKVYHEKTMPLINYYRDNGLLVEINETDKDKMLISIYRELG